MPATGASQPHRSAGLAVGVAGATLAFLLWLVAPGAMPAAIALVLFAAVAVIVLGRVDAFHPFPEFGPANLVTLGRAALACLLAALVAAGALAFSAAAFLLALAALVLDGVDGWVARRSAMASRFGARFDMEVDALLALVLAAAAWTGGKAGPWVLLLGLMRYCFVVAGALWPALAADLPPSRRRKAICVFQLVALALLLLPPIVPPASSLIALAALAALGWSFAVDVGWLLRRRPAA